MFRKIDFLVASIFDTSVKFPDLLFVNFLDLNKSTTVLLALLLSPPTTSLLLALKAFEADFPNNLVVFNIKISGAANLLKP